MVVLWAKWMAVMLGNSVAVCLAMPEVALLVDSKEYETVEYLAARMETNLAESSAVRRGVLSAAVMVGYLDRCSKIDTQIQMISVSLIVYA